MKIIKLFGIIYIDKNDKEDKIEEKHSDNINLEKSIKKNSEKKIKSQNVKNKIRKSKRKNK